MSDPVTDVEIEDVLSSIRRLVGDENRVKSRLKPVEMPKKPTRLVLTPSLMVPDSDAPDAEPELGSESEPETRLNPDPILTAIDSASVDDTLDGQNSVQSKAVSGDLEPEPGVDVWLDMPTEPVLAIEAEFDPDTSPESPENLSDALAEAEMDEPANVLVDTDETGDDSSDQEAHPAPWYNPDATLFQAAESSEDGDVGDIDHDDQQIEDRLDVQDAQFVNIPETPDTDDNVDPDDDNIDPDEESLNLPDSDQPDSDQPELTDDQNFQSEPDSAILSEENSADSADEPQDFTEEQPEDANKASTDPEDDVPYSTATLSAKIAALEAKIGQTQDQWEPDGEMGDDYAGTHVETIKWQDHKAEESPKPHRPALNPAALDPGFVSASAGDSDTRIQENSAQDVQIDGDVDGDTDGLDLLEEDDAILDEESLRELVADIVRQELQGALGERITRNVRKLVRREIHRALTAQELE